MRWLLYTIVIAGCGGSGSQATTSSPPVVEASAEHRAVPGPIATEVCSDPAVLVEDGRERGRVCPGEAAGRGLAIIDLEDTWTPRLFTPQSDGSAPSYRARYLALMSEHDRAGKPLDPADALAELYGVPPSLAIVRARLADEPRHLCNDFIDSSAIPALALPYAEDFGRLVALNDEMRIDLEKQLERERARRGLPELSALAEVKELAASYARWARLDAQHRGIIAAQNHYV